MGKRIDDALKVRDAALIKMRADGEFEEIENFGPVLSWKSPNLSSGGLHMLLRTPFQRLPGPSADAIWNWTSAGCLPRFGTNLPYGLDIWAGAKILNIEWDGEHRHCLRSFKRGAWIETVLSWATD